jgi:hypothetical protein
VLDTVADAAQRLAGAMDAYNAHGGDRCPVRATALTLVFSLEELSEVLTNHGIAFGRWFGRALDGVAALVDSAAYCAELPDGGEPDGGVPRVGAEANAVLRLHVYTAGQLGRHLRDDLDELTPPESAR